MRASIIASEVWGPNRGSVQDRHLTPVGETGCSYHNTDGLTGVLAPMVSVCSGGYMRRGFGDVAEGLKAYAEAIQAGTGTNG